MRLGQLARKLAVRPSQIVDFLSTQQIYLEEGSNAKLYDEHVEGIVQHFAPERLKEIVADIKTEEAAEKNELPVEIQEFTKKEEKEEVFEPRFESNQEKPELIKAPKLELSGLKVLGKIELLEPKKKKPSADSVTDEPAADIPEKAKPSVNRKQGSVKPKKEATQPWRNPIALQREREAREAEEQKKAAAEREKERRREHYLKRVKVGQPTKPARIINEPMELHITQKDDQRPLGLWSRFMKWLNG